MVIAFEEFEKVMANCFEVFSTWDDEYDKLQGLMRDIVKKKRDEHLKMVWRVNFSHKRLQVSIEFQHFSNWTFMIPLSSCFFISIKWDGCESSYMFILEKVTEE